MTASHLRRFRSLNIVDNFNREILHIGIATGPPSQRIIRVLEELQDWRGLHEQIRVDNVLELMALRLTDWCMSKERLPSSLYSLERPCKMGMWKGLIKLREMRFWTGMYLFLHFNEVQQISTE
ncbi:MAG: transposase InsO family protein [Sediminicola sp.]